MKHRVVGIDLGIRAPSVAMVADTDGTIIGNAVRFELGIDELERVEVAGLEGAKEGTKLHVVMEQTYPTSEYVTAFFLARGHKVSFAKPNQVKEFRKCLSPEGENGRGRRVYHGTLTLARPQAAGENLCSAA